MTKDISLRRFISSLTFAVGFVLTAVYFFDVKASVVLSFFWYSILLVILIVPFAWLMSFLLRKIKKRRKLLVDLDSSDISDGNKNV
jgi:cation transporter-like permease